MEDDWTTSLVECDICTHKWVAVYTIDSDRLECPHCDNMASFEEIETEC